MNAASKKVYKYNNRVQAVVKGVAKAGIAADAARTGESKSKIAARILENHYKAKQQNAGK